ncbi:TetR family transcriptional regulator [Deinococcus sp.]|uniref:TetR family transcriptional regulator n=1 Tax=Deinococcus sp. TaxID=47478 RepID=UPI003C7C647B
MGRWQSGAGERLERAALDLFLEQGFDATTVPQITARAGLTTRTFFRHYADKREVVFGGVDFIQAFVVSRVIGAPASATPIEAVARAYQEVGANFQENIEAFRQRQHVIDATPELQARELGKLAVIASAIAQALCERGVADPVATMAAELGTLVFRLTFERWLNGHGPHDWSGLFRDRLKDAAIVIAGAS